MRLSWKDQDEVRAVRVASNKYLFACEYAVLMEVTRGKLERIREGEEGVDGGLMLRL
jgi:hypothetical protein